MSIALGTGNHYSVILKDGVIYTAGENTNSQLARGDGTELELTSFKPIVLPEGVTGTITEISGGQLHGAFLTDTGDVYTWGDGNLGKLGNGSTANVDVLVPTKVAALDGIDIGSILMANGASYAISEDGVLYAWGQNSNGQLGIGNTTNQGSPVALPASAFGGEKIVAVSSGTSFTLVLTESGEVYAMGGNVQGQLGPNGSGRSVSTPVRVDIPGTVVSIEAGTNTAIAILDDGTVYGWGQSDFGQLVKGTIEADGTLSNHDAASTPVPAVVEGLPADVTEIHIGSRWGIAITASGEVWVWGDQGWLDSTREDTVYAPRRITDLDGVRIVDVVSGPNHALLTDEARNVYGLGHTADGRLGFLQAGADRASGPVLVQVPSATVETLIDGADDQTTGSTIVAGELGDGKTAFHIYGFAGDDTLVGAASDDLLNGGEGDDAASGGEGADTLHGNAGDDRLAGQAGDDMLFGGAGSDIIEGGEGDDAAHFEGAFATYSVVDYGSYVEVTKGGDTDRVSGVEELVFADATVVPEDGDALFDTLFYLSQNPDVLSSGIDPLIHYAAFGAAEGRDPNAFFDTDAYRALNPDAAESGLTALDHYHMTGAAEGLDISVNFDAEVYLAANPDVAAAGFGALEHYLVFGRAEGRDAPDAIGDTIASDGFDATYYILANPDVAASGLDARDHYEAFGALEGRDPNAFFDADFYLAGNPDVAAAGFDPLAHYDAYGFSEGRDPSEAFDTSAYLEANQDVAASGLNPLYHYLQFGIYEGRAPGGDDLLA